MPRIAKCLFRQRGVRRNKNGLKAKDFLVPVGPLRILFKNKFLAKLGRAYKEGWLIFPGKVEPLSMPKQVLAYLGRYTHRVAISNSRLLDMENGKVTFKLKNFSATCITQGLSSDPDVWFFVE